VREESHLDDMRSAIRGDFERLAERRGGQELMSVDDDPPEPTELGLVSEPEPAADPAPAPALEPEHVSEPAPEPEPPEDERPASWLDRLLGR
jgi:hypothetical protein